MISAVDLTKRYGKTEALRGISLDIADGEFTVIIGATGSGKSTLLSVLSGLERPDSGSVIHDGLDIASMKDKELTAFRRRKVGFIFQRYYLLPHLSVEANVRLGANLAGNNNVKDIIESVGLGDRLGAKPSELSGGEMQRVCIARALAKNPSLLFLDEPTGALDENTGRSVLDYIMRLRGERGFTMVAVTHNANIADMADRVIFMNSGEIKNVRANVTKKTAYEIGW